MGSLFCVLFNKIQMDKKRHIIYSIILILYYLPFIILGENFPLDVFDNMNSNIVWNKIAFENWKLIFSPLTKVPNLLGGQVPFSSIFPGFNFSILPFIFFGSYWGVVINHIIMSVIGYFGILKLFSKFLKISNKNLIWIIAVSFSLIPFWGFSMHVIGLPLLFYSIFRLYNKTENWKHWAYVVFFGFNSDLVLIGIFTLIIFSYILCLHFVKFKRINYNLLKAIIILSISYCLTSFPLIYSFLFAKDFVSHRTEMSIYSMDLKETMNYLWNIVYKGDFVYHGPKYFMHTLYILPVCIGLLFIQKQTKNKAFIAHLWVYYFVAHLVLFLSTWKGSVSYFDSFFKWLPIAIDRFLWFIPIFWVIMMAYVGDYFISKNKKWQIPVFVLIFLQFSIIVSNHKYFQNKDKVSFKNYYSEEQFREVKKLIGKDQSQYKIMNIGLEPAISEYNGFHTLGGFSANYSLDYKHNFHKIIKEELLRENGWPVRLKFEFWGSMCYFFSIDFGLKYGKPYWKPIDTLLYDWDHAKQLGAKYVFSPCELNLKNITQIELVKSYKESNYYYPLNVYRIK